MASVIVFLVVVAVVVRTFLFQPFSIPSGAMLDTLRIGDHVLVSKLAYGYSRFSFPFEVIPFAGRVLASSPALGDVVIFRLRRDDAEADYVKRVVGLPGDTVQMIGGVLFINGVAVPRERIADYVEVDRFGVERRAARFREKMPNGAAYDTLDLVADGAGDDTPPYVVPAGNYFTMGDNRDTSLDSRHLDQVGYVPFENLIGKVVLIHYSEVTDAFMWLPIDTPRP